MHYHISWPLLLKFFAQWSITTTSCKSTWDTLPYFGLNGLSMILCLWPPLHPFSKLLAIQDHAQNLEEQPWMGGGGRSVFYLTDLWLAAIWSKTGCFSRECLNIFTTGCSSHYSDFLHYLNMNFFEYSLDDFHAVCFWESLAGGL